MMESEKSGLYWLCKEAENRSSAVDSPSPAPENRTSVVDSSETRRPPPMTNGKAADSREDGAVAAAEASVPAAGEKRRRGRPARGVAEKRKKKEDEDVCFICFDGGSLVLCDRGDCPKAYHPACIKRDEAFFSSKAKWNCGWHICSICQKSAARYMCYTCTYSFCKGCTKDASYLSVRGNKGFCSTCFRVIKMIENIDQENKETGQVDFDDKLSWEYLFKVYWICLKSDLSLTVDEINRALLLTATPNKVTHREKSAVVSYIGNKGTMSSEIPKIPNNAVSYINPVRDNNKSSVVSASWASKELLDFVAYMRNGEISALSQREVQALLFDYIKRNNLRDPHQRSEIICDIKLQNIFGKPRVRHFEMLSLLEFHFLTKDEMQGGIIDPVITQVADESNSDNLPMISESYRDKERVDINRTGEVKDTCQKLENHVDSSSSTNNGRNDQACMKIDSLSGVKSETSVASLSTGSTPSANDMEVENSWHYQDPKGKVQGPFSIEVLHNWSLTGIFPPDMRIWRVKTEERDSVLLADVIKDQVQSQKNLSLSPQEVKGSTSVSTPQHCDGPESGIANCVRIDTEAHSNGTVEMVKGSGPVVKNDVQINNIDQIKSSSKCGDLEPPKDVDSHLNQPQVKIDAQIKNSSVVDLYLNHPQVKDDIQIKSSSKSRDLEPPKVTDSSLNHKQIKIDAPIKNSSNLVLEPPKVVDTCVNHPQVKIDAQINTSSAGNSYVSNDQVTKNIKSSSKCSDAESPKVVDCNPKKPQVRYDAQNKVSSESEDPESSKFIDSYLNHPQVKNDVQIKSSSKSLIPEPPKVVDSYSNQPQVKNDARVKKSSKRRNPKLPKVVDSCSNHLQGKSDVQKNSLKHLDQEQSKVVDSNLNHPEIKNDASIKISSKCRDQELPKAEPPKVFDSNLNYPQVKNDDLIKISSKCRDQELPKTEPPKVFDSNLNYPQVKNNAPNDSFSQSWDPQPPKVVDSFFNHTQVKTEAQNNLSSKSWDPKPPTIVDSYLNPPQVNNDVQIKNSSRSWDLEPANVVNFNMNQAEVHSVELASSYKEKPHEIILHQERAKVEQMWSSTSNYENWSSQENTVPQSTDKECHEHQFNAQQYRQNSSANNWNSHESHPHYTAMANLTGSSEQKFTINLQDFPMPVKEQHRWPPPEVSVQNLSNIQNMLSLTPKSTHHDERDYFQNQKMSSLSDNYDKVRATDNKHFLSSNFPSEGCGPNWSSAGGTHLPKKATKPFMDEWDTSVLSVCSLRPHEVANNPITPSTFRNDEFLSQSPPNPVPNASSWLAMMTEPIEFNTLAEESVSDLLAEVDAMESNSDLESPNMLMDYADDLFNDSKSNCFTSLRGLSSLNDQVKHEPFYSSVDIMPQPSQSSMQNEKIQAPSNDALSSSIDIMLPPPQSNTRDENNQEPNKDVLENPLKKSKKHSSISSAMPVETKRFEISNNKHNLSPPKKIRDLADIMNGPAKHGTLNSTGSTRRESGQGTPRGSGSKNRSTQDGMSGRESSHQKHGGERLISPREKNVSPRDRNVPGGDSGFSKSRQSWSRQSSFGGGSGGHSRSLSRGQRVCKFYENGCCRKGAFCEYLHP